MSGKILVSRLINPTITWTLTDHRHLRGCTPLEIYQEISCFIVSEMFCGTVINHHEAGAVPLFRIRIVDWKSNSILYYHFLKNSVLRYISQFFSCLANTSPVSSVNFILVNFSHCLISTPFFTGRGLIEMIVSPGCNSVP